MIHKIGVTMETKIGTIQLEVDLGDKSENLDRAIKQIENAADKGADIVALPEMFLTGYNFEEIGDELVNLAEKKEGSSIEKISETARDENVIVIAPIPEIRNMPNIVYNSAIVIDNNGTVLGSYAKSHLWAKEKKYFKPGDSLPVFDTDQGKIGVMICYDAGFPEVARTLALKGAEIIIMPSAWRIQDYSLWDLNTRSRALENSLYLVSSNIVGRRDGKPHFFGNSRIVDPEGQVMIEGEVFNDDSMSARSTDVVEKIDFDRIAKARNKFQYLMDRRPDLYKY